MGRKNASGLRYLVLRKDNGQPTYFRRFPKRIRSFLNGQVIGPGGSIYCIKEDQPSIRVAFSKGSDAQVANEWAGVHPQLETIVASARAALRNLQKAVAAVNAISPQQHHQMLDQVRHGILAADDRIRIRPNAIGATAEALAEVCKTHGANKPATRKLQQVAQDVERHVAEKAAAEGEPAIFDTPLEEGELDVSSDTMDMLQRLLTITHPRAGGGRIKLSPEMNRELNGTLRDKEVILSPVETLLTNNGLSLPLGHQDRLQLALDMPRAQAEAYADVMARRAGGTKVTPPQPATIQLPTPPCPTLSAMRLKWIEQAKPGEKARNDNALYVDAFISEYGDLPIDQIDRPKIRGYRDLLAKRPRNMPRKLRGKRLRTQIAWALKQSDCVLLTPNTVNAKGIGALSVIMEVAIAEDVIMANPCAKLLLKTDGKACERLPYDAADINRLGSSPLYADGRRWKAGAGEAAFWMPLIGLFAGARLEEIGQLLLADIGRQGSIHFFNFFDLDDEGAAGQGDKKKLKTRAARRKVPVHPFLIELGFLRYVDWLRTQGETQLFPGLQLYRGRRTKEFSKWWGRFADEHVTRSRHKVFHSMRHLFLDRLRNMTGNEDAGMALAGHARHMYGRTISLETRQTIIAALNYPDVDLTLFRVAAAKLPYLQIDGTTAKQAGRAAIGTVIPVSGVPA